MLTEFPRSEAEQRLRALLNAERRGGVIWLRETDSTNRQLRLLAESGAESGTVLLADAQSAGRGRLGRSFASPAGKGIYLSYLLRTDASPEALGRITPYAAVAVRRAVKEVCGLEADIKWVNDLLCRARKLCGILTEGAIRDGRVQYAVIGIGLNVSDAPEDFPAELRERATSLRMETGRIPDRAELAAAIVRALEALPQPGTEDASLFSEYRAACDTISRRVRLTDGTVGTAEGIDEAFRLLVRADGGRLLTVGSGEAVTLA